MRNLHLLSGRKTTVAALVLFAMFASQGQALTVTLDATDSGWHSSAGNHTFSNENYVAGWSNEEFRNFFVFDLQPLLAGETILSATLRLYNPALHEPDVTYSGGYNSPDGTETYELREVLTPSAVVTAPTLANTTVFDDLGDGAVFGSVTTSLLDNGQNIDITINAAGLAQITTFYTVAGSIVLGGLATSLDSVNGIEETIWANTDPANGNQGSPYERQLILVMTPEPGTATLLALGLVGFGAARRRRA